MRISSSNGVAIKLHDLDGEGPDLLIAHATGFCARTYEPLAAALATRFHVWALDFRGHGDSTPPDDGDFNWNGMGDDVLVAAEAIGARELHAFGHSMGGAALLLAELGAPGMLASAYLYEPIVFPAGEGFPGGENPLASPARRRRPAFPSKADALYRYASRPPLNVLRADSLAAYVEHGFEDAPGGGVRLKLSPEDEARTFESETKVTVDRVAGLTVPTVVGVGKPGGQPSPALFGPYVVAALANARLVEYEHLGHFGPLEAPDVIAADIGTSAR